VSSDFHDDSPTTEQRHDFGVVVGDVGHARHKDDWRAVIVPTRVEVVNAHIAVVGEPGNDHGQRHFMRPRTLTPGKALRLTKSVA
jgi:hypothetical protein